MIRTTAFAAAAALTIATPALAEGMEGMPGMDMPTSTAPATEDSAPAGADEVPLNDRSQFTQPGSGTSLLPSPGAEMSGVHIMSGGWMTMIHGTLNLVYDWQDGPRGADKTFVNGMLMASTEGPLSNSSTLKLQAMLAPDPFMGRDGYPLLLQTGETADGVTPLVDRQHPHDLFMELSATYTYRFAGGGRMFLYAGLPGEPAFGPTAFMHRPSIMDSPEAPISHHWLDSGHVTFGVVTLGYAWGPWQVEGSLFNGREPDENRYDIETGSLDSYSLRLTWAPSPNWVIQGSWAEAKNPEQLHPGENQVKWSLSAAYGGFLGDIPATATLAWGRRISDHVALDAFVLEAALKPTDAWTLYGRAESTRNNELTGTHTVYNVGKVAVGAIRDWRVADHLSVGLGAQMAVNFIPSGLQAAYGTSPVGAMVFLRMRID